MSYPLIMLSGPAGSGKDTVAGILNQRYGATQVALADSMKRFCAKIFLFTDLQLWGPSEHRNAIDPRWTQEGLLSTYGHGGVWDRLQAEHDFWFDEILPSGVNRKAAFNRLRNHWFDLCFKSAQAEGLSPRRALQLLGTEFGRAIDRDIWVDTALRNSKLLLGGGYAYTPSVGIYESQAGTGPGFVSISDGRFRNELAGVIALNGETWKITGRAGDLGINAGHSSETELNGIPAHYYTASIDNSGSKDSLVSLVDGIMNRQYGVHPLRASKS